MTRPSLVFSLEFLLATIALVPLQCQAQGEFTASDIEWYIWVILGMAALFAALLIAVIGCYLVHLCRRNSRSAKKHKRIKSKHKHSQLTEQKSLNSLVEDQHILRTQIDWEIPRERIRLLQQLGIGEFGAVYDAEVRLATNMTSRALIKVFKKGTPQDLVLFRQEMEAVMGLQHTNFARLFGIVSHSPYFAVFELPVNGDLKSFLMNSKSTGTQFSIPQLLAMATDIAAGMAYLQREEHVHKDVAVRNCVVTQNLGVKIADYRVGRYLFRNEYAVQDDGSLVPIRWMAPECLQRNSFSLHSDVWAFGVVIWELLTMGQFPYTELTDADVVHGVCYEYQRLMQPVQCPDNIYKVMLTCWETDPELRPRMVELRQILEASILPGSRESSPLPPPPPHLDTSTGPTAQDAMQY